MRDPGFGAVEDVRIAVASRPRLQGSRVGARTGFGQTVGTEQLATQHLGQPLLLLLVAAEVRKWKARQRVHTDAERDRRPAAGELLEHLQINLVRLTAA